VKTRTWHLSAPAEDAVFRDTKIGHLSAPAENAVFPCMPNLVGVHPQLSRSMAVVLLLGTCPTRGV
jgi:hypothetical protein